MKACPGLTTHPAPRRLHAHLQHNSELAGAVVIAVGVQHSHEEPAPRGREAARGHLDLEVQERSTRQPSSDFLGSQGVLDPEGSRLQGLRDPGAKHWTSQWDFGQDEVTYAPQFSVCQQEMNPD